MRSLKKRENKAGYAPLALYQTGDEAENEVGELPAAYISVASSSLRDRVASLGRQPNLTSIAVHLLDS